MLASVPRGACPVLARDHRVDDHAPDRQHDRDREADRQRRVVKSFLSSARASRRVPFMPHLLVLAVVLLDEIEEQALQVLVVPGELEDGHARRRGGQADRVRGGGPGLDGRAVDQADLHVRPPRAPRAAGTRRASGPGPPRCGRPGRTAWSGPRRRPRARTTTSSTVWATSLSRWLETNTVRPCAASSRSRPRSQRMPSGSSPLSGSSKISTPGSPSSAPARLSRWRMPSENPPTRRPATSASPTRPRTSSTRRRGRPVAVAMTRRCWAALRPGVEAVAVQGGADLADRVGQLAVGQAADGRRPGRRRGEAEQDAQRGGLAGSVRPEESGHLAGLDVEGQVIDGQDRSVALGEILEADSGGHMAAPCRGASVPLCWSAGPGVAGPQGGFRARPATRTGGVSCGLKAYACRGNRAGHPAGGRVSRRILATVTTCRRCVR